jgi:glucose-6-phosphate 1-dehydrogenase
MRLPEDKHMEPLTNPNPVIIVIFGAAGDLTWRKLVPALYTLYMTDWLPEHFAIIGLDLKEMSDEEFRGHLRSGVNEFSRSERPDDLSWDLFSPHLRYQVSDFSTSDSYHALAGMLDETCGQWDTDAFIIYYLATPPAQFEAIPRELAAAGLARDRTGSRIVVEKPFGRDLESARALNKVLTSFFDESQIYRIDHYLGKETVQNILVLRFANGMFEPIWNRNHIDHVQITVDEQLGVGHRGSFYDQTGALRDMVPNHLFQLLSLVAMEPPIRFDAHSVRAEKADVLAAIQPQSEIEALRNSVRGQYLGGKIGDKDIADYRAIEDVAPGSTTETYVALKLIIDNWRWAGVPFYLRTGKALGVKRTEVAIKFKQAPFAMFNCTPVEELAQNYLVIGVAPNEGIALQFNTKVPGPSILIDGVEMKFRYKDYFKAEPSTGYETLIYDCMIGDNILFQRADSVEAGWKAVQPFIDAWKKAGAEGLKTYKAGSEGPEEANELLTRDGRSWRKLG